jgi:hypothetical protein
MEALQSYKMSVFKLAVSGADIVLLPGLKKSLQEKK